MNVLVPNSFQVCTDLLNCKPQGESKHSIIFKPNYFSIEMEQDKMQVPVPGKQNSNFFNVRNSTGFIRNTAKKH